MANLIEWLEKMQADAVARLIEENASLKRELAELRGENAIQTAVYLTESDQLRKTNDKLCRQLKEKEQLLAEITRHVAEAQEQPSKLATRAIGTPKADDIEKVLGGVNDRKYSDTPATIGDVERIVWEIIERLGVFSSGASAATDSAPSETALLTGLERGPS